jgi:hypothetical protein
MMMKLTGSKPQKAATVAVSVFVAVTLASCASKPSQSEIASANYGSYPDNYKEITKRHFGDVLKDPGSARYNNWRGPSKGWRATMGGNRFGYRVCVDVNAKNSYGGYTGRETFYLMINGGQVIDFLGEPLSEKGCEGVY